MYSSQYPVNLSSYEVHGVAFGVLVGVGVGVGVGSAKAGGSGVSSYIKLFKPPM